MTNRLKMTLALTGAAAGVVVLSVAFAGAVGKFGKSEHSPAALNEKCQTQFGADARYIPQRTSGAMGTSKPVCVVNGREMTLGQ